VREVVCARSEDEVAQVGTRACALGDSVRIVGRLKTVLSVESVVLEDEGSEVEVDVSLSNPCRFKQGRQYQFIGELEDRRNSLGGGGAADATPILVARIARDVTGLDMALYRAGLKAQERCLREIEERSSGGR